MPSESLIFTTRVDPISPPNNGGGAGYRPGSAKLILKMFITIVIEMTFLLYSIYFFIKEHIMLI